MNVIHNLILIGFMGTGKTTVGRECAAMLKWLFVDLDQKIEANLGDNIDQIFKLQGEQYFRDQESLVLREFVDRSHQVISTGGGIVLRPENRDLLQAKRQQGNKVVWLTARTDIIWDRVKDNSERPLLNCPDPISEIIRLTTKRKNLYQEVADLVIDTSERSVNEIVNELVGFIQR